ncbi:arsenite S-adenosylmethyltransferase [candidate division WOR-1 bacterium RIFOXYB2_FULL_48_7]|uniref:Arsenite methyltransferase n=1 Tax=candidate division WOR-1 bacterium RIFOXYB2_FULL_48_7 TaxID=1802583 RepID=A0A1F4TUF8_UNCSA|nr:MAG: arsenite S-adenosylmethyltransferase [candidate division WOR-1 bacterium RIFOXYB2_FULL_48_7]
MKKKADEIKEIVKAKYGGFAKQNTSCCPANNCCGGEQSASAISGKIGYSADDINSVPENANLGLGCGNPLAFSALKSGEVVLDLGSGAGFDAFLAAKRVGDTGKVIGVDMTEEMIAKASENAKKGNYNNVEFKLGEIEKLPVADNSIDVVISNCVINLSPDKEQVFKEAFRVLKPGGRLMVSDLVLQKELPKQVKESVEAYVGCIAGAILKNDYLYLINKAGFRDTTIVGEQAAYEGGQVVSLQVSAIKGHE